VSAASTEFASTPVRPSGRERRVHGVRQHAGPALGPQIQVDAVAEAVVARRLEPPLQHAHESRDLLVPPQILLEVRRVVHEEQIDVGGEVELASAELAEREERRGFGLRLERGTLECADETAVGEIRKLAQALLERSSGEIARRDP
jgi:hypothetical protein